MSRLPRMLLLAGALRVAVVGGAAIGTDEEDEIFFGAAGGEEPAWRSAPLPSRPLAQEPVRQPARTVSTVRIGDADDELALDSEVHSADETGDPTPDLGTRVSRADNDELELGGFPRPRSGHAVPPLHVGLSERRKGWIGEKSAPTIGTFGNSLCAGLTTSPRRPTIIN